MSRAIEEQVLQALSTVIEPDLQRDLVSLNMIRDLRVEDGRVAFSVMLTTPACPLKGRIERESREAVMRLPGIERVDIKLEAQVTAGRRGGRLDLPMKNTIAVASGKGGVGKSTVAVNFAIALAQSGASVGLMDADVYGPNIPIMMGLRRVPRASNKRIIPLEAYGVRLMSMGFLVDAEQPLVWRGPMLHNAIRQFLSDVDWGGVDYLVIDLPPGTGDVQLTLSQSVPLTGAIIVTTPQAVALSDVRKGVAAFNQLQVPIIGVVENMSTYICPQCGHEAHIFAHGGGREAAERFGVPFLGEIPLDPAVREGGDIGAPVIAAMPHSLVAAAFRRVAEAAAQRISVLNYERQNASLIQVTEIETLS